MIRFMSFNLVLALLLVVSSRPALAQSPLRGAWVRIAETRTAPDTSWNRTTELQPNLYIFLDKHYSVTLVPGTTPRKPYLGTTPTDAEKIAAFDWFIANAGTYDLTDSTLTIRPIVSKNPSFMSGNSLSMVFRARGDSLWLVQRSSFRADTTKTVEVISTLVRRERF